MFLNTVISLLGDEIIDMILHLIMSNGVFPVVRILRRSCNAAYRRVYGVWARRRVTRGDLTHNTRQSQGEIDDSSRSTPSPPTTEQTLTDVRAESARKDEQITRKDDRIAKLTKAANASSTTIANLNRFNSRLSRGIRRTLDPRGLYPDDSNVLIIANHVRRDLNRVSKKVERQRKDPESSTVDQQNEQLLNKAVEIARLSAENERLKGSVLGLEQGQRSSVEAVERIQQAAKKREDSLTEQRTEAQRKLSNAISPRTHDTLRNQFNIVRDAYFRVEAEKNDAMPALQAEDAQTQPEAQEQSEHPVMVGTDALQEVIEQVAALEPKAAARDEEVEEAEKRPKTRRSERKRPR